jgi:hypothetical protein
MKNKWNKISHYNYLQGTDNTNNFLGTILAIHRNSTHSFSVLDDLPFSVLLYFDHRTGRVERYLANSKDSQAVKIMLRNEKHHIFHPQMSFENMTFTEGRINNEFFYTFVLELYRDYFWYNNSFKICDMNYLRNYTLPLNAEDDEKEDSEMGLGTGKEMSFGTGRKLPNCIPLRGTDVFKADQFIKLNPKKTATVNIPNKLSGAFLKNVLKQNLNIELIPNKIIKDKSPDCLMDLKRTFNARKITKLKDLNNIVIEFNNNMHNKLINM